MAHKKGQGSVIVVSVSVISEAAVPVVAVGSADAVAVIAIPVVGIDRVITAISGGRGWRSKMLPVASGQSHCQ